MSNVYFRIFDEEYSSIVYESIQWDSNIKQKIMNYKYYLNPGAYYIGIEY